MLSLETHAPPLRKLLLTYCQIQLSPNLQWVPCYDDFTCTKLEVPIDYTNISLGTTGIAFIKLAGSNATDDAESILINPGERPRTLFSLLP